MDETNQAAEKEVEIIRGEPIEVMVGGKHHKVCRLSIDAQIDVMDIFGGQTETTTRAAVERMVRVISLALGREIKKDEFFSAAEIIAAFNSIWRQNGFDFLLQQVGDLKLKAS